MRLDNTVKSYGFQQNVDELLVYKHFKNEKVVIEILYVDDILFGNDERMLTSVKCLVSQMV